MPTGSVGPGPCPAGSLGLVPDVYDQIAFWEKAALAALAGYAGTMNAPEDMAERVSRLADGLTRNWLRRLDRWSRGEA